MSKEKSSPPEWVLERMRKGSEFHKLVAEFYKHDGTGFRAERALDKAPQGDEPIGEAVRAGTQRRRGRADVLLWLTLKHETEGEPDVDAVVVVDRADVHAPGVPRLVGWPGQRCHRRRLG